MPQWQQDPKQLLGTPKARGAWSVLTVPVHVDAGSLTRWLSHPWCSVGSCKCTVLVDKEHTPPSRSPLLMLLPLHLDTLLREQTRAAVPSSSASRS
jgi:hypothetical protein